MIISPTSSLPTYDPASQMKSANSRKEAPGDGSQPPAPPTRGTPPPAVTSVVEKTSLSSDKIYDRRDANQDGTVSYQEKLQSELKSSGMGAQGSSTEVASVAYNMMGKPQMPNSGSAPAQSSFNLLA